MKIYIDKKDYNKIINHCVRKLNGDFYNDETKEKQAFGAIVGKNNCDSFIITKVICLKKNYRYEQETSKKMNSYIEKYAIPGGFDISERAWAIDPIELNSILLSLSAGEDFLGTYHMHSDISWKGDYPKYLPTNLDRKLNINSGLINLIAYIGKDTKKIRAFYESDINDEYEFIIMDEERKYES